MAEAWLLAGPRCRSPSLSPLAMRCLLLLGTRVATGEGRAVSRETSVQLQRANQPGVQGLAANGFLAPLQRAVGTRERALTPGLTIPQRVGARSLLPGQHVRQKIDLFLQAVNRRPPCVRRERASDGHPGTRLCAQPGTGPSVHPRGGSCPSTSRCGQFGVPPPWQSQI